MVAEPDGGETRGDAEDAGLRQRTHGLAEHEQREATGVDGGALDPGARRVQEGGQHAHHAQPLPVEQPGGGQDERDVDEHVDHGEPVDGQLLAVVVARQRLVVVAMDHVEDYVQMNPLICVTRRKASEQEHHNPSPFEHSGHQ